MMFALLHNGGTNMPHRRTEDGRVIPDASVSEMHEGAKDRVKSQISIGIKAEELGFDRVFFTEHHFQPTGSEFSPNPLMAQVQVASETDAITIAQLANIITWHDPVRFAEQTAMLDVIADGRVEIGIGRGYQPRENEVLGQYWGGTIQDQERNRRTFEEKLEIIRECWTQETVRYRGEFHSIPPSHTKWHHDFDKTYFDSDVSDQSTTDMMEWADEGDFYSDLWNQVMSGGTTLKRIAVFPQPVQEPYPQLWMPTTSYRSIRFAAQEGINGGFLPTPTENLIEYTDVYYDAAEEAGWPDRRSENDGEPFNFGWDDERDRGVVPFRYVWNTDVVDSDATERWKRGQENVWNYYRPLIPVAGAFEDIDAGDWIQGDQIIDHEMMLVGSTDEIIDEIDTMVTEIGYEDFAFGAFFDTPGITLRDEKQQMESFASDVMPYFTQVP